MGKKGKKEKKEKKLKGKRNHQQNPFDNSNKGRKGRGKGRTKQDKNWDRYFKEFQTFLEPRGIYMRDVEGDGNCLFRSIADHVDGDESKHEEYREMAVEYITKHKDYFGMFLLDDENIDQYIKDMSESGTWGGHFELVALSALLKARFCLHIKDKDPFVIKSSEMNLKGTKMIHLAYHVDEHYSSVRKLGDDAKAPAETITIPIVDDDDDSDSDSSEGDSTEGSDKEMSHVTEEVEKLHIQDRKNKNKKGKNDEEHKSNRKKKRTRTKREKEGSIKRFVMARVEKIFKLWFQCWKKVVFCVRRS